MAILLNLILPEKKADPDDAGLIAHTVDKSKLVEEDDED